MKRLFDVLISCACLVLVAPVAATVAIAVGLCMGRPILFSQERPGYHGNIFRLYKFRTMNAVTDSESKLLPDEQRLTTLGRILRSTSLDELPSLWNVLKGDMSLVGPRPLLVEYLQYYSPEQMRRHEVRPGVTGWAQVNGRNALSWEEKFALDVWYVDNRSMLLDLKILLMTVAKVLKKEGISQKGQATMEKFTGTKV